VDGCQHPRGLGVRLRNRLTVIAAAVEDTLGRGRAGTGRVAAPRPQSMCDSTVCASESVGNSLSLATRVHPNCIMVLSELPLAGSAVTLVLFGSGFVASHDPGEADEEGDDWLRRKWLGILLTASGAFSLVVTVLAALE